MNATDNQAVFLSYASQDAEAVARIAGALRAAGVEVWFDVEGGLETGDEWDAKIRKQIKECVLFLPVISANTQAREEGYFRIEWELAAQRALGIASGVAFILPIVIDDTREPVALVPDRFRSVQWTRAQGGELSPGAVAKLAKLWSQRAGLEKSRPHAESAQPAESERDSGRATSRRNMRAVWIAAIAGAAVLGGIAFFGRQHPAEKAPSPAAPVVAARPAASVRDWPKNPELKRAMALLDGLEMIPEDVRLAEEMVQRVLNQDPTNPESVTAMARVHSLWLLRGWDRSSARFQKAKASAERALQLAPDEPEAHSALAIHLYAKGADDQRALALAQRAVDLCPQEPRFHRIRDNCLWVMQVPVSNLFLDIALEQETEGLRRALDSARRTVEKFPQDPLVRYELSRHYRDIGRWEDFERTNEEVLALAPLANAMVWRARARFGLHGDLAGMKTGLDQVPARVRGIERTVFSYFIYAAFSGDYAEGLTALNSLTEPWMIDFDFRGPKALLAATLLELSGKKEMARVNYETAWTELQRSRSLNTEDSQTYLNEAWIKFGLGRPEEARAALRIYNESLARPHVVSPIATWWFQGIAANLLLGEREFALTLMRETCATVPRSRATLRSRLALDPRMGSFRDDPEILAILAEPASRQ